ncbi:MAG: hypothetical protein A2745_01455 [Candidatus Harrisonbacteria bacterium RIFCSPHIGHO2_01_FULL_44_13]|uniref:DUF11 domain-containing protein n=1 Tax=Candidatus Harrisonbacteria bacterium RIFCSPLOWO2_01_FULL_44_18 TaxID=1798407 RepID=A0A1G1ZN18_9BACT|nr:MAG: hypothetical protein A2745_01455 [Candidatus Harrisonbacteria bacterium RIFCSPHIGHO2_01_FULL_44_13]OGY65150.1 MAG: hypothetical protein A3A16_00415 [Candidatus Harrisonbacteria bacterium RIFCSPLOWO2_01_FULL_44_18]
MLTKLYWILAIVLILLIGLAGFFWFQSRSNQGLDLQINAPDEVLIGVPFDLEINVTNDSGGILKDSKLSLAIPEDVVFVGSAVGKTVEYKTLGNLGVGNLTKESFKLMALGEENSLRQIEATLSYLPTSLGSRFEIVKKIDLEAGQFGLVVDLTAPEKVFSGEDFEIAASYKNVSGIDLSGLILKMEYPPTFNFIESSLEPDAGNNVWNLGDLRRGSEMEFKIKGNLIGPDDSFFDLRASLEANFLGKTYVISGKSANVSISPSPLSLRIFLNEDPDYVAGPGDVLNYSLAYANNTDVALRDVVIEAKLIGEMFDLKTLNTNGITRSGENALVWNASNLPELAVLPVGASGTVNFQTKVANSYPIKRLSDKNFVLKAEAQIESPTVPYFVGARKTVGLAKLETKVAGQIKVDTKVYFRDAASGILNKGPMPLKAGQPTQFTAHWFITNFGTDVSGVEVRAFLEGNVRMIADKTKSNSGALPVYNERTQEVVWLIDRIPATKGVIGDPLEAIFQIEAMPSANLAGTYMPLIKNSSITATDDFTGLKLSGSDLAATTALPDDPTVGPQGGIVKN